MYDVELYVHNKVNFQLDGHLEGSIYVNLQCSFRNKPSVAYEYPPAPYSILFASKFQ